MRTRCLCRGFVAVALTLGYPFTPPARAASVSFRAELKAANVVPPREGDARGYLQASYDTVTRRLSWSGTHSDLSSKITGIHFHGPSSPNATAGVVQRIRSLSNGSATLSDREAVELIAGSWYVDVHTRAHPEGEIRGQIGRGE
jgi:hypothetical protein